MSRAFTYQSAPRGPQRDPAALAEQGGSCPAVRWRNGAQAPAYGSCRGSDNVISTGQELLGRPIPNFCKTPGPTHAEPGHERPATTSGTSRALPAATTVATDHRRRWYCVSAGADVAQAGIFDTLRSRSSGRNPATRDPGHDFDQLVAGTFGYPARSGADICNACPGERMTSNRRRRWPSDATSWSPARDFEEMVLPLARIAARAGAVARMSA